MYSRSNLGRKLPAHCHARHVEATYLISGRALVTCGESQFEAKGGDYFYGPHNTWLGFKSIGQEPLRGVAIFRINQEGMVLRHLLLGRMLAEHPTGQRLCPRIQSLPLKRFRRKVTHQNSQAGRRS